MAETAAAKDELVAEVVEYVGDGDILCETGGGSLSLAELSGCMRELDEVNLRLQQRLRGDNGAIPGDCAEVAPAEVAPAEVAPAEVAPAEVAPAEVAPAEVAPAGGAEVWDAA
jgi:hypothetical protein